MKYEYAPHLTLIRMHGDQNSLSMDCSNLTVPSNVRIVDNGNRQLCVSVDYS